MRTLPFSVQSTSSLIFRLALAPLIFVRVSITARFDAADARAPFRNEASSVHAPVPTHVPIKFQIFHESQMFEAIAAVYYGRYGLVIGFKLC